MLCKNREIDVDDLLKFIPVNEESTQLATITTQTGGSRTYENEREMLFKILYEMRGNVSDLRREIASLRKRIDEAAHTPMPIQTYPQTAYSEPQPVNAIAQEISEPENLNLTDLSKIVLEKALERNGGNRKKAAIDLGISDRTLYRRLKQFGIR